MDDCFYDSLEEDSFCECYSDIQDSDEETQTPIEAKSQLEKPENLSEIIPLYHRETPKTTLKSLKKSSSSNEPKKNSHKDPIPLKQKRENRTYLNLFYNKIKYPAIGGGDFGRRSGSETTRAHYDPSSRKSSAVSQGKCEEFFEDKEYSSDESSFYEKFIAEEELKHASAELKSQSGTISNFLSVSEQCLSNTKLTTSKRKKNATSKASSVPSSSLCSGIEGANSKLQSLRKRQYYGKKVSNRNKAMLEEAKLIKNISTKLKITH